MSRLGITRDIAQLADIKQRAGRIGVEVIALPLIKTDPLDFVWPVGLKPDWIFFTSANGVSFFIEMAEKLSIDLSSVKFGVVGEKTEQALGHYGFKADFIPSQAYGKILFEEFAASHKDENQKIVFARASEINFDPEELFHSTKIDYYPVVCYATVPKDIDKALIEPFTELDSILFTAPSTVRSFDRQFGNPNCLTYAIGDSTASQMKKLNWKITEIMNQPDIDQILEYI